MKNAILIPARMSSSRLPEKPLADIRGKSMIMRVFEQAAKVPGVDLVLVATDHEAIAEHVHKHGGKAILTSPDHTSGTDRIAEVVGRLDCDLVINVQGDEPFIEPQQIRDLVTAMESDPDIHIATQRRKIAMAEQLFDYNIVKVVCSSGNEALYFSRQAIPACRDHGYDQWMSQADYFRHIGIYGYRRETLLALTQLPPSSLERAESLEQLRWLENGFRIFCFETGYSSLGVDTPEDLEEARRIALEKATVKPKG